jgi:hypothetical protein
MAKMSSIPTIFAKKGGTIELPYEMVYIEWIDAVSQDEWRPISGAAEDIGEDGTVRSVGFLKSRDKENTVICTNVNVAGGGTSMEFTIPTGVITKYIKITKGNLKKIPSGRHNIVLSKWIDAATKDKWEHGEQGGDESLIVNTIGFEVFSGKRHITFCNSVGTEGDQGMIILDIKIPKPMIRSSEILKQKL